MEEALTLLAVPMDDERGWILQSPAVGRLGELADVGAIARPGQSVAVLHLLGRQISMLIPQGVAGHLAPLETDGGAPPRLQAVAYGTPLAQVLRVVAGEDQSMIAAAVSAEDSTGLVFRAPQAGRFFRAPEPGADPYLQQGDALTAGRNIGLIEVMKTFSPVKYQPGRGLPATAKAGKWLINDGAEVDEGTPILELDSDAS